MSQAEIFQVSTHPDLAEAGGGHGNKGINFQRVWAVARMIELDQEDKDFLMLFEAIQDIAEFDSEHTPTTVRVYQVKKKDSGIWSWNDLTKLYALNQKRAKTQALNVIKKSTLGKLYQSVIAFKEIKSTGHFASNLGCDLPYQSNANAATSMPGNLSMLESAHLDRLSAALALLHADGAPADPTRLSVMKIPIHPDAPEKALTGIVVEYLKGKSPQHAGQAPSLVEALLALVAPLSGKTDICHDFAQLRKQHGFSRDQFRSMVGQLEQIPDIKGIVTGWIEQLPPDDQIHLMFRTKMSVHVAAIFQMRLASKLGTDDTQAVAACDTHLAKHPLGSDLLAALKGALSALQVPGLAPERLGAHFLMRAAEDAWT